MTPLLASLIILWVVAAIATSAAHHHYKTRGVVSDTARQTTTPRNITIHVRHYDQDTAS